MRWFNTKGDVDVDVYHADLRAVRNLAYLLYTLGVTKREYFPTTATLAFLKRAQEWDIYE